MNAWCLAEQLKVMADAPGDHHADKQTEAAREVKRRDG